MSDGPVTLLICPPDPSEPEAAFNWLPKAMSGVAAIVMVAAKVQPPSGIRKINIASDYTAELARIQSLASIARARVCGFTAAADSMALFGLQRLLELRPETVRVALLREKMVADPACLGPAFAQQERPFTQLAEDPGIILFDRSRYGADLALSLALDTVLSGAIYAAGEASLAALLEEAQKIALSTSMQEMAAAGARPVPSGVEVY